MKQMSSIQSCAWNVEYDFTDAKLTGSGGISFAVNLTKSSGLIGLWRGSERHAEGTLVQC